MFSTNAPSLINIVAGDHVLVTWESRNYPGRVVSTSKKEAVVTCMKQGKNYWRWPLIKDEQFYIWKNVIRRIKVPKCIKKSCFSVPEVDDEHC